VIPMLRQFDKMFEKKTNRQMLLWFTRIISAILVQPWKQDLTTKAHL
jgi:hypothetical protein